MGSEEATMSNRAEGVGHTLVISDGDMERIKVEVTARITDVLPGILLEVVPDIISRILPNIIDTIEDKTKSHMKARKEAERIMKDNQAKFNECSRARKKLFGQYRRCESLLQVWDECKAQEPPHIPRKFREDKFHVKDREELDIVNRRSWANFQCQYDLLSKRKPEFAAKVNDQDDKIFEFVENLDIPGDTKIEISKLWKNKTEVDENSVMKEWEKKIEAMKDAFRKDKETLEEQNRSRFGDAMNVTVRRGRNSSVYSNNEDILLDEDNEASDAFEAYLGTQDADTRETDLIDEDFDLNERSANGFTDNSSDTTPFGGPEHDSGSTIHGFTSDTNDAYSFEAAEDEYDPNNDEHPISDETQLRINRMAVNFEDSIDSHFQDTDRRRIPHDFFLGTTVQHQQKHQERRNTFPRL